MNFVQKLNSVYIETLRYPYSPSDFHITPSGMTLNFNWESVDKDFAMRILELHIKQLGRVGVYSMTQTNHDLLMWSHYADSHRGFVIGYDSAAPIAEHNDAAELLKVIYSDDYPKFSITDFLQKKMQIAKVIATHKGLRWQDEREWRIVFPRSNYARPIPWPICEIVFGHRMEKSHTSTIYRLVTNAHKNVSFFDAVPSATNYKLELLPYDSNNPA